MEFATPVTSLRTQLCVVVADHGMTLDREAIWPDAAEEFLRRMYKLGIQVTVVGARPPNKFGSKKTLRFMDRHEVVAMKILAASRSHPLELRILNVKTKAWTRLRAQCCVTFGTNGIWPKIYDGWAMPGTLTIHALARWMNEQKWMPGREFAFIGSSNQAVRWASVLLDRGAKGCYVIESEPALRCWRAYGDRFLAKGGRFLVRHELKRVEANGAGSASLYLDNDQGTLIVEADTLVLTSINEQALNDPTYWKRGLFYVQRRTLPHDRRVAASGSSGQEEEWLERVDWREIYWRVARFFEAVDHSEADGALKSLRNERRKMALYRRPEGRKVLGYSGKILDRETLAAVQSSPSVPRSFATPKPVASLECFEEIPCRACADACPEAAIDIPQLLDLPKLKEDKCTGCGACVAICPAGVAVMVKEAPVQQKAKYFFADDTVELWKPGRLLQLLNRRGETLGTGRVVSSFSHENGAHRVLEVESSNVHLWEARNFRVPKNESGLEPVVDVNSPSLLKRGWVRINGVRRLCPVDVPITVALWQLGQRRFEDARFCDDAGCRMCEVRLDDKPVLACKTLVKEGQSVEFFKRADGVVKPICPCKQVAPEQQAELLSEGVSPELARELTGVGRGACHGRWCLSMCESGGAAASTAVAAEKGRPVFHGYEASPWRDVWAEDVGDVDSESDGL